MPQRYNISMKILILRNNVTDITTLNLGTVYAKQWASTIGLDLEFDFKDTSTIFTSFAYTNDSVGTSAAVYPQEILSEIPVGYDVGCLVYDWLKVIGPQPKNPFDSAEIINGVNPMQIPIEWYSTYPEVFAQFFLHELCHMESFKQGRTDITHLLTDGKLQAQMPILYKVFSTQHIENWYLYLLNSLVNPIKIGPPDDPSYMFNTQTGQLNPNYKTFMKSATLTRNSDDGTETTGTLITPGFSCYTLERSWKDNQPMISSIPPGSYQCMWSYMTDLKESHYVLLDVAGRSGVFIHEGNFYTNSEGCILLGDVIRDINADREPDVLDSRTTLAKFEALMGQLPFQLTIK